MKGKKDLALLLTLAVILSVAAGQVGCARQADALESAVVQYIPPNYYDCIETTPNDLLNAYYSHYNAVGDPGVLFDGHIFVFKGITITAPELNHATDEFMWIDGAIKCYFLEQGSAGRLSINEKVDIVGIDSGVGTEYNGTLVFEGCIFLPSGSVQLPAGGGSSLTVQIY